MNTAAPWMLALPATLLMLILILGLMLIPLLLRWRRYNRRLTALLAASDEENRRQQERLNRLSANLATEQAWSALFRDRTGDLMLVFEPDAITHLPGPFTHVNEAACTRLMYKRERLLSLNILDLEVFQPPSLPFGTGGPPPVGNPVQEIEALTEDVLDRQLNTAFRRRIRVAREEGRHVYECALMARNGEHVPVEVEATPFENNKRHFIVLLARDLTERRQAREALVVSERRSRDYFANAAIGAAVYSSTHVLIDVNRIALKLLGTPDQGEFVRFNPFNNPFMSAEARDDLARGSTARYEAAIDFGAVRDAGLFISGRTGKANLDIMVTNLGLDRQYEPKGYLVQIQDITQRRTMEEALEQSERQLRQAQKMQAIGTLAGGIAHDFNNILTPILGYSEMAVSLCEPTSQVREFLGEVIKASLRAKDLANQILTFSRQGDKEGRPIRLTPIVKEVAKLQQATLADNVTLQVTIKTDKDVVIAEPTQIHQILMNLCTNASHAMQGRAGAISVILTALTIGRHTIADHSQLAPGAYLRISVIDSGSGMTADTQERIFDPFFTTKARGEGTGMGLAVVHGIVTGLKGTITVHSQPGQGSEFHVLLPLARLTSTPVDNTAPTEPLGHECILFVDDELDIVKLQSHVLASLGYRPVLTDRSTEALRLYLQEPGRFDLVITDQVMPELSGTDLARQIHKHDPTLPIILCTGFSETFSADQLELAGITKLLLKPIVRQELAVAIRQVLDGPRA